MRWSLVLLLVACESKPRATSTGSGSGSVIVTVPADAAAAVVDAAPVLVDLFRAVPMAVEVSSRVANPKIKPSHLVDRDMNTAWNSVTGELAGTWLEIGVPDSATVYEVRMTVGHTGRGPKGEDYFAMNHRISRVTLQLDGKKIATERLDPDERGLQTISIPARVRGAQLRIVVDETVAGTKPKWQEVCVSELELWGTADKVTPGAKPRVFEAASGVAARLCDGQVNDRAYPECTVLVPGFAVSAPWQGVGVQDLVTHRSEHHGHLYGETIERRLVLVTNGTAWTSDVVSTSSQSDPGTGEDVTEHIDFTIEDVKAVKGGKLAVRFLAGEQASVVVCAAADQTCGSAIETKSGEWPPNL